MIRLMVAAPSSGSGKTVITCALLRVLQQRGLDPCAFKCGPDYIDPMFHRAVLGLSSHNLDLFLSSSECVRSLYHRYGAGHGSVVCEGVMGLYDGVGGRTDQASSWALARCLDLPVLLVVRPHGASLTVAAQIKGMLEFRRPSMIKGVIFNGCSPQQGRLLASTVDHECGVAVVGTFPEDDHARFSSRHLGLYTAGEIADLNDRIDALATRFERSVSFDRLEELFGKPALCPDGCSSPESAPSSPAGSQMNSADGPDAEDAHADAASHSPKLPPERPVTIALAADDAFCFVYRESLDMLRDRGVAITTFSPLEDRFLPTSVGGLYLPGGYPELHAKRLSEQRAMRRAIREAVGDGLPTIAECGGYLYLCRALEDDDGACWPAVGVVPGTARRGSGLTHFGYALLSAERESLLFEAGQTVPVHEFHYWRSDAEGDAFVCEKPVSGRTWKGGFSSDSLYAAFPHLYFAGSPSLVRRFAASARSFKGVVRS